VFFDLIHMDDCDDVAVSVGRCHEGTDDHYDTRFRMLHADGSYRWIRSLGRVLERDADGQPLRVLGQHIDVTEEVEAKAQLAAREELLSIAKRGLDEAQRVGQLGNWTYDLATGAIEWSDYLYELFDRDPALGPPAYDEGLLDFTPESREILDRAVRRSAGPRRPARTTRSFWRPGATTRRAGSFRPSARRGWMSEARSSVCSGPLGTSPSRWSARGP
jgi:PAS domain-containing protein